MRLFTKTLAGGPIAATIIVSYDGRTDAEREADYKAAVAYYQTKMGAQTVERGGAKVIIP